MKKLLSLVAMASVGFICMGEDECSTQKGITDNKTAMWEQSSTESNQRHLFEIQPPPKLSWSLERDNLIKRFRLQNDRAINFYMYVFLEGVPQPIGYYLVNKVSSVDSQLTNTMQVVPTYDGHNGRATIPSPAEDGSYGTNGVGVFGFTPEDIYIEHNMHYICSTVPLNFGVKVIQLNVVTTDEAQQRLGESKKAMNGR